MDRCSNCQFENVADARACARCGQRLTSSDSGAPEADGSSTLPDWMRSVQAGANRQSESGVALLRSGGVAEAATLPVQVRRSRVPVLSVGSPTRAAAADAFIGTSAAGLAPAPASDETATPRAGNRLPLILLAALIVALIIFVLARLALHGAV